MNHPRYRGAAAFPAELLLDFHGNRASVTHLPSIVKQKGEPRFFLAVVAVILGAAGALTTLGTEIPATATNAEVRALSLKDIHGKIHQPLADTGQKATVFFFVLHDCPLANTCAPEMNRIEADYRARGIRSFVVYVEEALSPRAARQHAIEYGFACPTLLDREQKLRRFTGAKVSPEAVVLGQDNALLYRGRIDDRLLEFGKQRVTPTRRDLREALEEILSGKPVSVPATRAVGCYLPTNQDAVKTKRSNLKSE